MMSVNMKIKSKKVYFFDENRQPFSRWSGYNLNKKRDFKA